MAAAEKEADAAESKLHPKPETTGSPVLPERRPGGVAAASSDVYFTAIGSAASPAKDNNSRTPSPSDEQKCMSGLPMANTDVLFLVVRWCLFS